MAVVTQPKPTGAAQLPVASAASQASIELYWLPLGAGGWFVRLNGRIWEAVHALLEHRRPLDLYHTALQVRLPDGRFVVENCWPIPDADPAARGVAVEGPVASRQIAHWRVFRYEVRRWRDGVIADADAAVASPQLLSDDPVVARRLLDLVGCLPSPVWGRDELGTGEMWNSNSVIAWLLARSGLPMDAIGPPAGGRAPGWAAGLVTAGRQQRSEERAGHGAGGATIPVGGRGSSSRWMRYRSGSGRSWSARGGQEQRPIPTTHPAPAHCREGSGLSSKPTKVDSDHHQRADGHVVAVGSTAATQASQGTVAAVVTTAIMVWSLVLVMLGVRANRRGGSVLRAQDNPARRRV